ncbi:MAG: HEPN domain-containing protein [Bacteroidetes bacterium]|nr:HEPN domain-containing protein [Bacteroidota bacterium]MBU2586121.1 HEPN domain-containing protein [Bacteroidota bacterium]
MTKEKLINYWVSSSEVDFQAMENLYKSKDFVWSLFVGHLVIEKLLKGLYLKHKGINPPPTHNLQKLAQLVGINITTEQDNLLADITTFNMRTRYPDQKFEFYKKSTNRFTKYYIDQIKELREWLKQLLMMP